MTVEASAGNTRASFWSARLEDASTSAAVPPHGAVMTVGTEVQMAATDSGGENVRVAVLGTGIMGSARARNLVSAGLRTTVWDRSPTATAQLAEAIEGGPLDAPIADAKLRKMERGDFAPEFPLEWALKDVDLALGAAGDDVLPLLAALSRQWR